MDLDSGTTYQTMGKKSGKIKMKQHGSGFRLLLEYTSNNRVQVLNEVAEGRQKLQANINGSNGITSLEDF